MGCVEGWFLCAAVCLQGVWQALMVEARSIRTTTEIVTEPSSSNGDTQTAYLPSRYNA